MTIISIYREQLTTHVQVCNLFFLFSAITLKHVSPFSRDGRHVPSPPSWAIHFCLRRCPVEQLEGEYFGVCLSLTYTCQIRAMHFLFQMKEVRQTDREISLNSIPRQQYNYLDYKSETIDNVPDRPLYNFYYKKKKKTAHFHH